MKSRGLAKPAQLEDADIVERIKGGQTQFYGRLVEKYQDRVFNTCWRICGNLEDARDITQEAFLKALDGIATFRGESGFYTWIFRVAVNLALSQRRRAKSRKALSLDGPGNLRDSQAAALSHRVEDETTSDPGRGIDRKELQARVIQALGELDSEQRAVVVLRDIEGLDYLEIGEILGVPVGTIKSRLCRARMYLRRALRPVLEQEKG